MTASSSKVGCRKSGAFFVPARPSKDPSPGRGVQAKPTFQATLVLTFRPGLLDGFIRISTSIPASLANCSNFSMENFPSRPHNGARCNAYANTDRKSTRLNSSHLGISYIYSLPLHDALPISHRFPQAWQIAATFPWRTFPAGPTTALAAMRMQTLRFPRLNDHRRRYLADGKRPPLRDGGLATEGKS